MRRKVLIASITILLLGFMVWGDGKLFFDFEATQVGKLPEGFTPAQTADRGKLSLWKVIEDSSAPSPSKALRVYPDPRYNHGATFNVLIYEKAQMKDLMLSVYVKAVEGREDQGGGLIWRVQDKNNYYITRWNPLENNFRLYYVKNGRRRMLATARIITDESKWHHIKVVHRGNEIRCYFDGQLKLRVKDTTFTQAGKIGLWTKADASTEFDNLEAEELK